MVWAIGPEIVTLQPFTNTITGIFSFFLRSGWSDVSETLIQNFTSIGGAGAASWGFYVALNGAKLEIYSHDVTAGLARHQVQLGDEDGVSWIQPDKWYQIGFSISASAFTYVINGSTTPYVNVVSAVNGNLNLAAGTDRWWLHNGVKANAPNLTSQQITIPSGWPTFIVGAAAWSTTYIDWSDATARGRVFDTDGNFKNPGENGSLWFDDDYDSVVPEFYFLDGSPRRDNGTYNASIPQAWAYSAGGGAGSITSPGGLRKQYENQIPDDWWLYKSLAIAEASGDAWVDGDTIYIPPTSVQFFYKSGLAVDGYSGLIHKYPFGTANGVLSAFSLKGSEAANTDPDSWVDMGVKTSAGTQGVDYELDTDGGLARMRDLSDAGYVEMASTYQVTAADIMAFRIVDDISMTQTGGGNDAAAYQHNLRIYKDATNYYECRVSAYGGAAPPPHYLTGADWNNFSPEKLSDVVSRIWLYISATKSSIWFDDEISTNYGVPPAYAGASARMAHTKCGSALAGATQTLKMGTDVFGSMTVS